MREAAETKGLNAAIMQQEARQLVGPGS